MQQIKLAYLLIESRKSN